MSEWVKSEGKMPVLGSVPVEVKFHDGTIMSKKAGVFNWTPDEEYQPPDEGTIIEWRHADPTDSEILDWLADQSNYVANVMLPNECVVANVSDMREAIKMAMRIVE